MTPLFRFHSIVLGITTLVVFYLWSFISTIDNEWKIPLIALISIGIYRSFMFIVKLIVLKIRFIKKFLFGAYYLEGVWVGFFLGKSDKIRYYVETFEQDFDGLIIKGKGFREKEGYFGSWISENVSINIKKGTMNYTYESNAFKDSHINSGLASFVFDRKTQTSPPYRLMGFSSDLYDPKKMKSFEQKIDDKPYIENLEEAINKAKQLCEVHKYFFITE